MLAPSPDPSGGARAVYDGKVAGYGSGGAVLWPTPSSYVDLNPTGYSRSQVYGIFGSQEVGGAFASDGLEHAVLWSSIAGRVVDLDPNSRGNSYAMGTDGAQQVGLIYYPGVPFAIAALWNGTASSFVNLNPAGYQQCAATGVYGGVQVGYGNINNVGTRALVWHGTASSATVLSNGAEAMGISRGRVVGWIASQNHNTYYDAAVWSLSGDFVNFSPPGATASELFATNGSQQVGDVSLTGSPPTPEIALDHHPAVWTATASAIQLLPLPQGENQGIAYGVDDSGDIADVAFAFENGSFTPTVPVLWVPHRLPGDANFDGKVDFSDLLVLSQHYGGPGGWVDGDFNGDGTVGLTDLLTLAQNYGKTQAEAGYSVEPVPEPSVTLIAAFALGATRRRRRTRFRGGGLSYL